MKYITEIYYHIIQKSVSLKQKASIPPLFIQSHQFYVKRQGNQISNATILDYTKNTKIADFLLILHQLDIIRVL